MERESRTRVQRIVLYKDRMIGFLREAAAEGADKKVPASMTSEQWERQRDIGKAYSYLTLRDKDLGKIYGSSPEESLTGERIRQIRNNFKKNLHNNASPELQERFPLSDLSARKPSPLRSEVILQVTKQVEEGVEDRRKIAKNTGLTLAQVTRKAQVLKRMGIEIPRPPTFSEELEEKVKEEKDDKKLQDILNEIPVNTIVKYMRGKDFKVLIFLTNVLKSNGFFVRNRELKSVAGAIKKIDPEIPIRIVETNYKLKIRSKEYIQSYMIVFAKHTDRILEAVRGNPDIFERLSDNPVKLLFGPEPERFPNTYELTKTGNYTSIKSILLKHFNSLFSENKPIKYRDLLSGCPVPILIQRNAYYYPIEEEESLAAFLREKLISLGKLSPDQDSH